MIVTSAYAGSAFAGDTTGTASWIGTNGNVEREKQFHSSSFILR